MLIPASQENKLFITLDVAHAYLQVPIADQARQRAAFISPDVTAECNCMIFGLMHALAYFAKIMAKYIGPLRKHANLAISMIYHTR